MKKYLVYFLFLQIINISFQVVPLWNFESSAFNLFINEDKYKYNVIDDFKLYDVTLRLEREIFKNNGNINITNTLFLNNENFGETDYDDVESFYQNDKKNYIICPKGAFHIYIYNIETKKPRIVIPNNFEVLGDWDLMCFYQSFQDTLFVAYLGNKYQFYQFNFQEETFKTNKYIFDGLYAFKWKVQGIDGDYWNSKKQMFSIVNEYDHFSLYNLVFDVQKEGDINFEVINSRYLTYLRTNYTASFQKDTFNFYWINYNSVYDFEIGSHSDNQAITTENIYGINIDVKYNPLVFFEKMTIIELKFIFGMFFAYYKLMDDKGKFYYGIIDVPRYRVIFHTDEEIIKYIPYLDYVMLAITKNSAYKICVSRNETDCERCKDGEFMLDSSNYNFCGTQCKTKFILIPYNICTDICDERIYSYNDKNECGLCKDLGTGYEYKFYNQSGCFNEKPANSIDVNAELKIIDCEKNYKYENGKCILRCHDNCEQCSSYSEDNNNQNCISCKNERLFIENGNCVKKCQKDYYLNEKECIKCDESCETCNKDKDNCTSCSKGKYLDNITDTYMCKNCNEKCETCNNRDNCITCNQNSSFKFLFNFNCYEKCPNNTIYNKTINMCQEIKNKNNTNSNSIILSIFTIITASLLFIVLFQFFRRYCCIKQKKSDNLLNKIKTQL